MKYESSDAATVDDWRLILREYDSKHGLQDGKIENQWRCVQSNEAEETCGNDQVQGAKKIVKNTMYKAQSSSVSWPYPAVTQFQCNCGYVLVLSKAKRK